MEPGVPCIFVDIVTGPPFGLFVIEFNIGPSILFNICGGREIGPEDKVDVDVDALGGRLGNGFVIIGEILATLLFVDGELLSVVLLLLLLFESWDERVTPTTKCTVEPSLISIVIIIRVRRRIIFNN